MHVGKHLLCEKPMALTIKGCKDILDATEDISVKFMIGQVCRYALGFVLTKKLIDGGCHAVDLVRWIVGDVDEVFAYSNHKMLKDWLVDDCTIANMRFENGIIGKVFVSIGCKRPYTMRSVFYGSEGTIISDNTSPNIQVYSMNLQNTLAFSTIPVSIDSHNVSAEIVEFVDSIINDKPVKTDAVQGMMTIATCVAAVTSAKKGPSIKVRDLLKAEGYKK